MRISNLSTIAVICLLSNVAASGGEPADDSILQALAQAGRSDADRDRDKHSRPDEVLAFFWCKTRDDNRRFNVRGRLLL